MTVWQTQKARSAVPAYDPILYLPEFDMTSAEITMEQKNAISHRGKALEAMKKELEHYFEEEA